MQKGEIMYLSELFLKELDEECSIESVMNALCSCEQEFRTRIVLSEKDGNEIKGQRKAELMEELRDFWDVYKEFDSYIEQDWKTKYEIFRGVTDMCRIMENIKNEGGGTKAIRIAGRMLA